MKDSRRHRRSAPWWLGLVAILLPVTAALALDLSSARSWQLANGLTLIVLEEHSLPVASVQMLYRVGARNEDSGRTGLAHFMEHMAFRATQNFPATGVVSSIYAVGGEWHGYTWIDQTTYFETVPREELDLALRIEADRLGRLVMDPADVAAERGVALTELHGYQNDLASVLHDAVAASAFLQHPYRNNTIGWESDVAAIGPDDLVAFYRRHYRPANAVLVVAGDVAADDVRQRVEQLFAGFPAGAATPPVRTVEPLQRGERRVVLEGAGARSFFEVAWVGPSARDDDYPAFLVLQEILAGGSGVNFRQSDGATRAGPDSLLAVAAGDVQELETWFPPAEFPYLFTVSGSVAAERDPAAVEAAIERAVAALRDREVTGATLAAARARVREELVFDVETTEDAAHELAYFAGLNALDQRLGLARRVAGVTAADLQRVARRFLASSQRTIGEYRAGAAPPPAAAPVATAAEPAGATLPARRARRDDPPSPPEAKRLANGLAVIVQRVLLSHAVQLGLLLPGVDWDLPADLQADSPVAGYSALGIRSLPDGLRPAMERLRAAVAQAQRAAATGEMPDSPEAMLAAEVERIRPASVAAMGGRAQPVLVTVVGDVSPRAALALLDKVFGGVTAVSAQGLASAPEPLDRDVRVRFPGPAAQAQLGYVVAAPPPGSKDALAWQLALYVLTHGYEGRLGLEAINRRGLVYYIDGEYQSDGDAAWIRITTGADAEKLAATEAVLREELRNLRERPPGEDEIAEARRHLLGRERTAAQSNAEIAAALSRQWLWRGRLREPGELARDLAAVTVADVHRILPALTAGITIIVEVSE